LSEKNLKFLIIKTKNMKKLLFALCFFASFAAQSQTIAAVLDGDSWVIKITDSVRLTVRLINVDCPEKYSPPYVLKAQPYGKEIGDTLRWIFKGKKCTFQTYGIDQYGRTLAAIQINGLDISEYILSMGYGWYVKSPIKSDRMKLRQLRDFAKKMKNGLWGATEKPINPKEWRKMHGRTGDNSRPSNVESPE
jgi:micrococcal nuclease